MFYKFRVVFINEVSDVFTESVETDVCVFHLLDVIAPCHVELAIVVKSVIDSSQQFFSPTLIFVAPGAMIFLQAPWITYLDKTLLLSTDVELIHS